MAILKLVYCDIETGISKLYSTYCNPVTMGYNLLSTNIVERKNDKTRNTKRQIL